MQVKVEQLSPVLVEFAVEIPKNVVSSEINKAYRELARTAQVKGFRRGKAPRKVLEHVYGVRIFDDVAQRLVNDSLPKALEEQKVQPLATLEVKSDKVKKAAAFTYKARFEVTPEVAEPKYTGFEVTRPSLDVADDAVDAEIESMRRDHSTLQEPEPARAAKEGDMVTIDFQLSIGGEEVADGKGEDVQAELGQGQLLPALEEAIIGTEVGAKAEASVTFDENHPRDDFKGKEGLFNVTLKELKERVLPEINDDFAQEVGDFENLEGLKKKVSDKLKKQMEQQAEDRIAEQLVAELCKANPVDVPPTLVQKQMEVSYQEMATQAAYQGQRLELTDQLRGQLQADAEMKVRAGLVMAAIAREKDMKIVDEDIEKAYEELAEQTGKNVARLKAEYADPKRREMLIGMILEDKILDIIEGEAKISEA